MGGFHYCSHRKRSLFVTTGSSYCTYSSKTCLSAMTMKNASGFVSQWIIFSAENCLTSNFSALLCPSAVTLIFDLQNLISSLLRPSGRLCHLVFLQGVHVISYMYSINHVTHHWVRKATWFCLDAPYVHTCTPVSLLLDFWESWFSRTVFSLQNSGCYCTGVKLNISCIWWKLVNYFRDL